MLNQGQRTVLSRSLLPPVSLGAIKSMLILKVPFSRAVGVFPIALKIRPQKQHLHIPESIFDFHFNNVKSKNVMI